MSKLSLFLVIMWPRLGENEGGQHWLSVLVNNIWFKCKWPTTKAKNAKSFEEGQGAYCNILIIWNKRNQIFCTWIFQTTKIFHVLNFAPFLYLKLRRLVQCTVNVSFTPWPIFSTTYFLVNRKKLNQIISTWFILYCYWFDFF